MTYNAFPLQWPDGWPRARGRRGAPYRVNLSRARDDLINDLRLMGAKSVVVSTNAPPRTDNTPMAGAPNAPQGDPGVAVYFLRKGEQQVIACDRWDRLTDNLRACGLTIAALRMIERSGASELLNRAFTGFKALPAATSIESPEWWCVLGVEAHTPTREVKTAYRILATEYHPDRNGGDAGAMARINGAWESFKAERGL